MWTISNVAQPWIKETNKNVNKHDLRESHTSGDIPVQTVLYKLAHTHMYSYKRKNETTVFSVDAYCTSILFGSKISGFQKE